MAKTAELDSSDPTIPLPSGKEPGGTNGLNTSKPARAVWVDQLKVVYPNGTVGLSPTTLNIGANEMTVLLGPSGAGKSTLLRALNLLVKPTGGAVINHQGLTLSDKAAIRAHRRETAMIFQQHQLIGRQTALQNVLTGRLGKHSFWRTLLPFSQMERKMALASLHRVGLFEKALARCDNMSGGQQQRVGIARALAQQPSIILADEPVASLDPASSQRVLSLLRQICREDGLSVVVSLHQLDYAREFADRIIGLAGSKVVFDGPPAALNDDALVRIYGS
ncbi:MAG: phosphonate ABC transporter ATP-binding protein [Burkholderiaceae bacterium]